jgi:hypothetical protein
MKMPSIPVLTWTIAVAAVLCAVWLAASESSGPEQALLRLLQDAPATLFPTSR